MHGRHIIIATDDAHTGAWLDAALEALDATREYCSTADAPERVAASEGDLLVVDAGRAPEPVITAIERAAAAGADIRLLVLIEAEALAVLRMPVGLVGDFMVRGASPGETIARARVLLWPGEEVANDDIIRIDDLALNLATYQVTVRGEPVEFTYLEYALFVFLVTHPNRVYTREVLLRRVWGTDYFGGARTVDVHVRRVRSKLGPEVSSRIETVRNVGYLWRT